MQECKHVNVFSFTCECFLLHADISSTKPHSNHYEYYNIKTPLKMLKTRWGQRCFMPKTLH